jgi:hypothetical protein
MLNSQASCPGTHQGKELQGWQLPNVVVALVSSTTLVGGLTQGSATHPWAIIELGKLSIDRTRADIDKLL